MAKNKKTKIEQFVIDKIKEVRTQKGYSQDDIALFLETTRGFIGQVESPNHSSKYNLNHINKLAVELNCSPKDFLPDFPFQEEV
ncbi:helix-turn-helix transcriptional regulator [Flavobacterium sp.]|uniref:helix-turn-helix domain-containing protein n=1 Tax=Flavobacterium sp. TaxID=239 RepID=UPI00262E424C|nr:helix-turn-helix transcriptional regulator [Flavobacterium sp.]